MGILRTILGWLTGGALDRVLDTVDKRIQSQTDRERIKGEIVKEHVRNKASWMRAGGFWLMLIFALPLGLWWASVLLYSVLWCAGCAFPQGWTIAALPPPLDDWAGMIVVSIFGVLGVDRLRR